MPAVLLLETVDGPLSSQRLDFADGSRLYIEVTDRHAVKLHFYSLPAIHERIGARAGRDAAMRVATNSWSFDRIAAAQMSQAMLQINLKLSEESQVQVPTIGGFSTVEYSFIRHGPVPQEDRRAFLPVLGPPPEVIAEEPNNG